VFWTKDIRYICAYIHGVPRDFFHHS